MVGVSSPAFTVSINASSACGKSSTSPWQRAAISRHMSGESPENASISDLSIGFSGSKPDIMLRLSSALRVITSGFFCGGGSRYFIPGSRTRSASPPKSMRRRQSIIRPSAPISTRFELRPISSTARRRSTLSPSSLLDVMSTSTRRSHSACSSETILPPTRYLRSSIQNMGGSLGFSKLAELS